MAGDRRNQAILNSHIYAGFAGQGPSSHNAHGTLLENCNMWWDEEKIERTVTRQFVSSKLRPDEQVRLDEPLGFGDGLTDDTYMEWIDLKAKRIFLILVDLGVPDQIFGVIDDSWDDDDLPVPMDQVERLHLTYDKDEKLERKFFHRQFTYLLKSIQKGDQIVYRDQEVVPLELAERKAVSQVSGLTQSNVDKVHLPGRPDDVFIRRKIPLGLASGRMPREEFLSGVAALRAVEHDHLVSLWASYIYQDCGYILLTPVNDSTLKSFLAVTPQSIKILAKQDRRTLLLNWLHCLADALASLHERGLSHGNIKPSTVLFDQDSHVFLGDYGILSSVTLMGEKRNFDKESYDYAAAEQAQRPPTSTPILVPMTSPVSLPGTIRRSTLSSQSGHTTFSPVSEATPGFSSPAGSNQSYSSNVFPNASPPKRNSLPKSDPQKADIFSLGTIFLEVLTFFMKRASRNFASHRSAKNKTPGRGGGLPDSSFHKNLSQVDGWMAILAKDASKKEDKVFRGISHILALVEGMIAANPDERPDARHVQERLRTILVEFCGLGNQDTPSTGDAPLSRGSIHCDAYRVKQSEWNFGFEDLRIASQRAAAEACARVSPSTTEPRVIGTNGGVLSSIESNSTASQHYVSSSGRSENGNTDFLFGRLRSSDGDGMSMVSRSSSGDTKSRSATSGTSGGKGYQRPKPKARAYQAPVYSEFSFGLNEEYSASNGGTLEDSTSQDSIELRQWAGAFAYGIGALVNDIGHAESCYARAGVWSITGSLADFEFLR